jgi:hypothetical protein
MMMMTYFDVLAVQPAPPPETLNRPSRLDGVFAESYRGQRVDLELPRVFRIVGVVEEFGIG